MPPEHSFLLGRVLFVNMHGGIHDVGSGVYV